MERENESVKLKSEINLLTRRLSEINIQKRQKIKEIEALRQEIRDSLNSVKDTKTSKPNIKEEVEKLKSERDIRNKKVQELISNLKELKNKNIDLEKKSKNKFKLNPLDIKKRIEFLEEKIQTEVISFDKEKQLMSELKRLKSDFKNSGDIFFNKEKEDKLFKEIREEKEKANEIHKKIRDLFDSNKEKSREFRNVFKKLDSLRENKDNKQKEIDELNNALDGSNKELNDSLAQLSKLKDASVNEAVIRKEIRKKMEEKIIEEKSKIVEDKIKNKAKLTKEDFLIYQKSMLNKEE